MALILEIGFNPEDGGGGEWASGIAYPQPKKMITLETIQKHLNTYFCMESDAVGGCAIMGMHCNLPIAKRH